MPFNLFFQFLFNWCSFIESLEQIEEALQLVIIFIVRIIVFTYYNDHLINFTYDESECNNTENEDEYADDSLEVVHWNEIT